MISAERAHELGLTGKRQTRVQVEADLADPYRLEGIVPLEGEVADARATGDTAEARARGGREPTVQKRQIRPVSQRKGSVQSSPRQAAAVRLTSLWGTASRPARVRSGSPTPTAALEPGHFETLLNLEDERRHGRIRFETIQGSHAPIPPMPVGYRAEDLDGHNDLEGFLPLHEAASVMGATEDDVRQLAQRVPAITGSFPATSANSETIRPRSRALPAS